MDNSDAVFGLEGRYWGGRRFLYRAILQLPLRAADEYGEDGQTQPNIERKES
jgi:hypothetical protein